MPRTQNSWLVLKNMAVRQILATTFVDMVAAVREGELLGAMDINRRGAQDTRFWAIKVGPPFLLYWLHEVPLQDARVLNDFGSRMSRIQDGKQAWRFGRNYADFHPFKRIL